MTAGRPPSPAFVGYVVALVYSAVAWLGVAWLVGWALGLAR